MTSVVRTADSGAEKAVGAKAAIESILIREELVVLRERERQG